MTATGQKAERAVRERDIEKYLVRRVEDLGGEVRKVQWIGRRGAPDRFVMLPERWWKDAVFGVEREKRRLGCGVWVELKAPGVAPEDHQLREHERMRKMGQRVVVIDSFEGVDGLLA